MKNIIIILSVFIGIGSGLFAQSEEPTNEELLEKIEILEAEIEKVKIEAVDDNPLATGDTLNWGNGYSIGLNAVSGVPLRLDLMHNFRLNEDDKKVNPSSNNQGNTVGIGLTLAYSNINYHNLEAGIKVSLSSSVLLNYFNITTYINPYVKLFREDQFDINGLGLGLGLNLNLWLTNKSCIFTGVDLDQPIYVDNIYVEFIPKTSFGIKYFF